MPIRVVARRVWPGQPRPRALLTCSVDLIDETTRQLVLAVISVGGSLRDAAAYASADIATVRALLRTDQVFSRDLRRARARCKVHQLQKLAKATQWQSAKFMLERLWPDPFARGKRARRRPKAAGFTWGDALAVLSDEELELLRELLEKMDVSGGRSTPPARGGSK